MVSGLCIKVKYQFAFGMIKKDISSEAAAVINMLLPTTPLLKGYNVQTSTVFFFDKYYQHL